MNQSNNGQTNEPLLSRKAFLIAGALLAAPGCGAVASLEEGEGSPIEMALGRSTTANKFDALKELGRLYLESNPGENDAGVLTEKLGLKNFEENWFPLTAARKHVLQSHLDDLPRDRFVRLDGWMFTQTEARLYALLALV